MTGENPSHFRRQARILAVQALYEMDLSGHPVTSSFSWLLDENEVPPASADYGLNLAQGVVERLHEVDELIHRFAPMWPVNQLPVIDRNILRLAVLELFFTRGAPQKVVINEAVELAKTFGSESSAKFVNGVLGSMVDNIVGEFEPAREATTMATNKPSRRGK